jgi:hypothetical protein
MRSARVARKLTRRRLSNCRIAATPRVKRAANIGYFVLGEVPHTMMVTAAHARLRLRSQQQLPATT